MCSRSIPVRGHTKVRLLVQGFQVDLMNTSCDGIHIGGIDLPRGQEGFFCYARNAVSCEGCSSIVCKFSPLVMFCSATKRKCFSANDTQGGCVRWCVKENVIWIPLRRKGRPHTEEGRSLGRRTSHDDLET